MFVMTVVLPSRIVPLPTSMSLAYTSTGPLGTFAPVVLSVTLMLTVTLPAVLFATSATVVLLRCNMLIL